MLDWSQKERCCTRNRGGKSGVTYFSKKIDIHPNWDIASQEPSKYDIAIITLNSCVSGANTAARLATADAPQDQNDYWVVSAGSTKDNGGGGSRLATKLQKIQGEVNPIIRTKTPEDYAEYERYLKEQIATGDFDEKPMWKRELQKHYRDMARRGKEADSSNMLTFKGSEGAICKGDSGGPLFRCPKGETPSDRACTQIGVAATSSGCQKGGNGFYVKVKDASSFVNSYGGPDLGACPLPPIKCNRDGWLQASATHCPTIASVITKNTKAIAPVGDQNWKFSCRGDLLISSKTDAARNNLRAATGLSFPGINFYGTGFGLTHCPAGRDAINALVLKAIKPHVVEYGAREYSACQKQGRNLGEFSSAKECSTAADGICSSFMYAPTQRHWGCRCCDTPGPGRPGNYKPHDYWNIYIRLATVNSGGECNNKGKYLGVFTTAGQCAITASKNGCANFMHSDAYPSWGCRCCSNIQSSPHKLWKIYNLLA